MKALKLSLLAAAFGVAFAGAAQAADGPDLDLAFNVGAQTDYVFRGVSQTNGDASVYGGVDAAIGKIGYAGTWLSNVDFANGTDFEYDLYAGIRPQAGPVTFDLGVIRYGYAGSPKGSHQNYWEGKAAASMPFGPATFGAVVYYSPDFFGGLDDAWYYEVNGSVGIPNSRFSVSGALGRQELKGPGDYTTWNLGLGYAFNRHLGVDVRYFDTDEHRFGKIYDSRVVGGIKLSW
jgi:uncharacterized protein (TIGR02001 family)